MAYKVALSQPIRLAAGVLGLFCVLTVTAIAQTPLSPGIPVVPQPPGISGKAPTPYPAPTQWPAGANDPVVMSKSEVQKMIADALAQKECEDKQKKASAGSEGFAVGSQPSMTGKWNNGLWFETPGGDFRYHIGGAVQYDAAFYNVGDRVQYGPRGTGEFGDGVNLRRGRLRAEGGMWELVDFTFELEFFNGLQAPQQVGAQPLRGVGLFNSPGPTDAWITLKQIPVLGNFRIGSMKEPFSLEHLNSYRYLEFMERSYLFDAFQPTAFNNGFSPGLMFFNTMFEERGTWWIGAFKNDSSLFGFNANDGEYALTGRLTGLPVWANDGATFWHIGTAASMRDPVNGIVQERVRSQIRNGPFPVLPLLDNTGNIRCDSQTLFNVETAAVVGSFTFQAEYTATWMSNADTDRTGPVGTYFSQGCYAEVLYFLTGEHRSWDRKNAIFGRVIPHNQAFLVDGANGLLFGPGAWEVGARYSYVDLTNKGIDGGVLQSMTLGLNWYLNPNCKIQWNYDLAHRGQVGAPSNGYIQAFGTRMAMDF